MAILVSQIINPDIALGANQLVEITTLATILAKSVAAQEKQSLELMELSNRLLLQSERQNSGRYGFEIR